MKIADILQRKNNNVDLLRLVFAFSVIWNHTVVLNGYSATPLDHILFVSNLKEFGPLAVKLFFFFSGIFATNSLLQCNDLKGFIVSRSLRILPAFFFVLMCSALFIGPCFSKYSLHEYFQNPKVYAYVFDNITFRVNYALPGIFESNLYKGAVNGSLWTLPYEVKCYAVLLGAFLICQSKNIRTLICLAVIFDSFLPQRILILGISASPDINLLPMCFAFGALLANNADAIEIDGKTVFGGLLLAWLANNTESGFSILVLALGIAVLLLSTNKYFLKIKPKYDISYGVYLWGFVVQQSIYDTFGHISASLHFAVSVIVAIILAIFTYILVEQPAFRIRKVWQLSVEK